MSVEFRFLELRHYDNEPHFQRFSMVLDARKREATVLLPAGVNPQALFDAFLGKAVSALNRGEYLPIARFCDGEYNFYSGKPTATCWGERGSNLRAPGVEKLHLDALRTISARGLLCPNLNLAYIGAQSEFLSYLSQNGMPLQNYVPFYYVYALLVHPQFMAALEGRAVAMITSLENKNMSRIRAVFEAAKVAHLQVLEIPSSGVAHGSFELKIERRPDIAFVGAGIGSPLVLASLMEQSCVAVDSGFAFHLWDGTFDRFERLFLNFVP